MTSPPTEYDPPYCITCGMRRPCAYGHNGDKPDCKTCGAEMRFGGRHELRGLAGYSHWFEWFCPNCHPWEASALDEMTWALREANGIR